MINIMKETNNLPMSIKVVFLILFTFLFLVKCSNKKVDRTSYLVLKYALNYYNIEDEKKWENVMEIVSLDTNTFFTGDEYSGGYYAYKKLTVNTMDVLYFEFYCNENDTIFIPVHYYQRFIKDGWQHILSFDKSGDTLYHYKAELFGRMKKFFISGEYSYRYEFGEMNSDERMFFEQHKDSLKRIRGMNLPPLLIMPEQSSPPILERRYRGLCNDV